MSVTILSTPNDLSSAYSPLVYSFRSTFANHEGTFSATDRRSGVHTVQFLTSGGLGVLDRIIRANGTLTVTNSERYNGDHITTGFGAGGIINTETPYDGHSSGGNLSFTRLGARMICNLLVNDSFVVQKTRYANIDGNFDFDFSREVQLSLGNGLEPMDIGGTGKAPLINNESTASIRVEYFEVEDIITDGVISSLVTGGGSSNKTPAIVVVNAIVPYLEWTSGSVGGDIKSTSSDLSNFAIKNVSNTNRFLTNSPKNITLGRNDHYQLSILLEHDAAIRHKTRRITYDASGSVLGTSGSFFSGENANSVWSFRAGGRGVSDLDDLNIASYDIKIVDHNDSNADLSETITFTFDDSCHQSKTRFIWLNPRGAYDAFNFYAPRSSKNTVSKGSFVKNRANPVIIGGNENPIISVNTRGVISVKTDKISTEEAEWLNELIESPDVRIELDGSNPLHNKLIPVTILDGTFSIANSYDSTHVLSLKYVLGFKKEHLRAN